jgi:two-component system response regulator AlgR
MTLPPISPMQPLKILVVDDEPLARERLANLLSDIAASCPNECVAQVGLAQAALDYLAQNKVDLILLDVQMPGMTGLELARHLKHMFEAQLLTQMPAIIFVTAYDDYALQAFEVHAMDYLLKPVRASRLQEAVLRIAQSRLSQLALQAEPLNQTLEALPQVRQAFSVIERNRMLLVPLHEVIFLKAELKYVTIQTKQHAYLTEESLVSIEHEFGSHFVRVHRNTLVTRKAILGVERGEAQEERDESTGEHKTSESWQVMLQDWPQGIAISRRQWPIIKALLK